MDKSSAYGLNSTIVGTLLACLLAIFLAGCGGGGSSGGGGESAASSFGSTISLVSITFTEYSDLSGGSTVPPVGAPLNQQIVFTFSGTIEGEVSAGVIEINASPGLNYSGPKEALDATKNLIPARGTYEVMNNLIVFTPYIPNQPLDLTSNAPIDKVPGLLPGFKYTIFVPVGTENSIRNLVAVDKGVLNPVSFTTGPFNSLYYSFRGQPSVPPKLISTTPADGTIGFNFNTLSDHLVESRNFPQREDIILEFDQPLDYREDNLQGADHDGDTVMEQTIYLQYTAPTAYVIVDSETIQKGFLAKVDARTWELEFIGYTNLNGSNVGLKGAFLQDWSTMVGFTEEALYDVDYKQLAGVPLVCDLTNERPFSNNVKVGCLVRAPDGVLWGVDDQGSTLLTVDVTTGETTTRGILSGYGSIVDLAMGLNGKLYGLRVTDPGKEASIELIDTTNNAATPILTGLQGDFMSIEFSRSDFVELFENSGKRVAHVNLKDPTDITYGGKIDYSLLTPAKKIDYNPLRLELGGTIELVTNSYHGAKVKLKPSGILPIGSWIDIMIRNSLANISGGSLAANEGKPEMGAVSVAMFKTYDPGQEVIEDYYFEDFLTNTMEETSHELSHATATWNVQDTDGVPPTYTGLLAGIGLSGGGELGDFKPIGLSPTVYLDTNYQAFPLFDGSTPDISTPIVVTDGEFHFNNIDIPYNVTIKAQGSNPLVFTATGDVNVAGTIDVSGFPGTTDVTFNSAYIPTPGGKGGTGAGRGGDGQPPTPPDFGSLTQLQSVARGERGWGPGDVLKIGGYGGESSSSGFDVPYGGSEFDEKSRGAGGGGGSYLEAGKPGYPGLGKYGVKDGVFYIRDPWEYWDGTYKYDENWDPQMDFPGPEGHLNHWYPNDPNPHIARAPHNGDGGALVFSDTLPDGVTLDTSNDFIGKLGELKVIQGGQGGGAGGSRMDGMNPDTEALGLALTPPLAPSAYDSKGGGGGGGGGAIAIHALGGITVTLTGKILARGGKGGGGEVIGHAQFGGGGGGGSGGAIVLNSATRIKIDSNGTTVDSLYGRLDAGGGFGADARSCVDVDWIEWPDTCELNANGTLKHGNQGFCSWCRGDGGAGGYGIIQLMVPNPATDLEMMGWNGTFDPDGDPALYSLRSDITEVRFEPNEEKFTNAAPPLEYSLGDTYAWYKFTVNDDDERVWPTTTKTLVDPYKTISSINALSFAVTKWIDTGRIMDRMPINGKTPPVFYDNDGSYNGFFGVLPGELDPNLAGTWAIVDTVNGYVVPNPNGGTNDIIVKSPDLFETDYVADTNRVGIMFQGADALVPGSKVPDPNTKTDWTTDLSSLQGKQFIRYRVGLNVAYGTEISSLSLKPEVNGVRIRLKY